MNAALIHFYSKIETEYEIESYSWNLFTDLDNISEQDRLLIRYENYALNIFNSDTLKKISAESEQMITYFRQRVETTKNIHLLSKYYHFLLNISKNNSFASKAIECYQQVLAYYLSIHNQDFQTLHFSNTSGIIISISMRYKIQKESLKKQINNYLYNTTLSSKIKTFIFENIRDCKLFESGELAHYPELCIELSNNDNDSNIKERLLNLAVTFSRKTTNTELFKKANELLGDLEHQKLHPQDDNNTAISHMNEGHYENIINYYKIAGNKEKQSQATRDLEENKKHHKYIKIESKIPVKDAQKVYDLVNECLESLLTNSSEVIILKLCFDNGSLSFPQYEHIKTTTRQQMGKSISHQFFVPKLTDINKNTTTISHEQFGEHQFFHIFLQNHTLPFVVELLKRTIEKRKLSYPKLKRTLLKTAFGIPYEISRGDNKIEYNWFSLMDIGFKEFFTQFLNAIKLKPTDWRFTIDFLTPKFEAILREIVQLSGGEITRVKENGDTELRSLEELLNITSIKEIFNEDDLFLFRHTFTKAWFNIRNDVAHGLCKPCDYSLSKAVLVFLCILRLNKTTMHFAKNSRTHETI